MRRLKQRVTKSVDDIPRLRAEKDYFLSKLWMPAGVRRDAFALAHMESEWFIPDGRNVHAQKVMLYLHGGGYAIGSVKAYRSLIGKLCRETGLKTLAINYRLAPEYPFPAALDDALQAYNWLIEEAGYLPKDIVVAGDSAGGGLTASMMLALREMNMPMPLAGVMICPWTDLAGTGRSLKLKADDDPILPACRVKVWGRQYAGEISVRHPFVSPLYGDLSGLPPMLIQVGTEEVVFDDSTRFARKAEDAGSPIKLEVWKGMPHVWHFCWHVLPESRKAIGQIADFIRHRIEETHEDQEGMRRRHGKVSLVSHAYHAGRLSAAILSAAVIRGVF